MEKLKATEALERRIDKILQDRADATAKLESMIAAAEAAMDKAQKEMDTAAAAEDAKAYSKAKATRADAADAKEMYELRLRALTGEPLITKDDYDQAAKEVSDELADLTKRKSEQLADLAEKMNAIAQEVEEATNKANAALRKMQHDLYRDQDRSTDVYGRIMFLDFERKSVRDTSATIRWGKLAIQDNQYQQAKEARRV